MKKDNFISLGIVLNEKIGLKQIQELHSMLYDKYNYFEIILLNYEIDINDYLTLLKELNNIRILELPSYVDIEIVHTALIENCIGDYCAIIDLAHDPIEDLLSMLERVESYDVVVGKRERKIQSFFESITSKIFYKAISLFTGIKIDSMYSDFFIILLKTNQLCKYSSKNRSN